MYGNFAKYYDTLMKGVDYSARTDYLCSLFEKFGKKPTLPLDLACGTGGFSNEFAARGVSVIGVDVSEEMLAVAQEKSSERKADVLYLCQPAQSLDLYGTVDGAVCLLDSLNHITDFGELCEVFIKVSLFLEKNSLFIFDLNTVYKHENVLSDNVFVIEEGDVYCVWQNYYSADERVTDIKLDFFEKQNGVYKRSSEVFCERAYTDEEIAAAAQKAGFKIEAVYGDMTFGAPKADESRAVFVLRKV